MGETPSTNEAAGEATPTGGQEARAAGTPDAAQSEGAAAPESSAPAGPAAASGPLTPEMEEAVYAALAEVLDPEIGLSVVDLDLIREVVRDEDGLEVRMLLTTPYCPYAPLMVTLVSTATEQASGLPARVTILPDRWEAPPWLR